MLCIPFALCFYAHTLGWQSTNLSVYIRTAKIANMVG